MKRWRFYRHDVTRLAYREQGDRQRAVAAIGDDNFVCRDGGAAVQHQAGDLLAQLQPPVEHVIAQHFTRVMLRNATHLAPQRLQARLVNVRRAAAKGDHLFVGAGVQQHHHFIPLGDVHGALHRARHRRDGRQRFAFRDKIAGARLRRDQLEIFEDLVGLLYGADAYAVLLAQRAYRRQTFAAAIQPLFNTFRQEVGQMLIARHAVSFVFTIQSIKPVQIDG